MVLFKFQNTYVNNKAFELFSDCNFPSNILHGTAVYTTTLFGDVVNVTCNAGYTASVDAISCMSNGAWDDVPTCVPVGKSFILQQFLLVIITNLNAETCVLISYWRLNSIYKCSYKKLTHVQ